MTNSLPTKPATSSFTALGKRFRVRPLAPADLADALELYRQCEDFLSLGGMAQASAEMVQADLAYSQKMGGVFCGLFDEQAPEPQLVGVLDYVASHFAGVPDQAFLSLLMIAAPARRAGIGRAAAAWLEDHLRRNPAVTSILSAVQVNNAPAIRFWTSIGYQIISGPEQQHDGTTTYSLRKILA